MKIDLDILFETIGSIVILLISFYIAFETSAWFMTMF